MAISWQKHCPNCGNALLRNQFKLLHPSEFGQARPTYCCRDCGSLIKYQIGRAFALATLAGILSFVIKASEMVPYPDGVWWVAFTTALMVAALFLFVKPVLVEEPKK
tara:strand:- start:16636 stop:16956 length:321 start_codon:yes stop_codon:yes gene_type:complete